MSSTTLPDLDLLRGRLPGELAGPGEPGYELATPWNVAVPVTPAAVVLAGSADDVAETVRFAAGRDLRVAVPRPGHGPPPIGRDGLVVPPGRLDEVTVDAAARTA